MRKSEIVAKTQFLCFEKIVKIEQKMEDRISIMRFIFEINLMEGK